MKSIINAKDIHVEFHGRDVLDIKNLTIHEYEKIGLIGDNGSGKSTLLKILSGALSIPSIKIERLGSITHLEQLDDYEENHEKDAMWQSMFNVSGLDSPHKSGGEITRLKLASAFSNQVHLILADEPTNHLDQDARDLVASQLKYFPGAVLVSSHDRLLLDTVVDKIWELKEGEITEYLGNYSDYEAEKVKERQKETKEFEQISAQISTLEQSIELQHNKAQQLESRSRKQKQKNKSMDGGRLAHKKSTGSKQKQIHQVEKGLKRKLEALEHIEAPSEETQIKFRMSRTLALHNPYPIIGRDINKRFGDKVLFDNAAFEIELGKKVAILGENGSGKSTLIEMILNHDEGISVSPKVKFGTFKQRFYHEDLEGTLLEYLFVTSDYQESEIRAILASLGFSQREVNKDVSVLSGGELMKLHLAKLLLGRYNVLLLDEPNNFLDMTTLIALENMIKTYPGTILFITHDKKFVENVADEVYIIKDKKLIKKNTD